MTSLTVGSDTRWGPMRYRLHVSSFLEGRIFVAQNLSVEQTGAG